jgi:hypothetical protein
MALTITVGVCRKIGLPGYSSVGAECSIAGIELDAADLGEPEYLQHRIRDAFAGVTRAVDDELARQQGQAPAPAQPAAAQQPINAGGMGSGGTNGTGYNGKERREWGGGYKPEAPGNGQSQQGPGGDRGGAPPAQRPKTFSGPPKTGRALYSWAKRHDEERGTAFVRWLNGWGKQNELDGRMSEWPNEAAIAAHRELMQTNSDN